MINPPVTPQLGDFYIDSSAQTRWAPVIVWICVQHPNGNEPTVAIGDEYCQGQWRWIYTKDGWLLHRIGRP